MVSIIFKIYFTFFKNLHDIQVEKNLDNEVKASGFLKKELNDKDDIDLLENYENLQSVHEIDEVNNDDENEGEE